jgi:hypothetical protein
MTTYSNTPSPTGRKSPSFGIGSFVFAVVLAFILYLLISTMISHHFFRGGHPHRITTLATQTLKAT